MRYPKLIITFSDGNIVERCLRECGISEYVAELFNRGAKTEADVYNEAFERTGDNLVCVNRIVIAWPYVEFRMLKGDVSLITFMFKNNAIDKIDGGIESSLWCLNNNKCVEVRPKEKAQ